MKKATICSDDFNRIIDATKHFLDRTSNRVVYQYIQLRFDCVNQIVTAVALDGYRMSVEHSVIGDCNESFIAYVKPNVKLAKNQFVGISVDEKETIVQCGEFSFGYAMPTGDFLDWNKVMPTSDPVFKIGFNGNYLLQALQAAKASLGSSFKNPVVLEFRGKSDPVIIRTNKDDVKFVLPIRITKEDK